MSELKARAAKELSLRTNYIEVIVAPGGLQKKVDGVHLGYKKDAKGNARGCVDEVVTLVKEAGIGFGVSQGSHGPTSIFAVAMEGFLVESGKLDPETRIVKWKVNKYTPEKVMLAHDNGNMAKTSASEWNSTNLGNPGVQVGVVRVTGPDSSVRIYALAAEFNGEPDDWTVHGGIMEIDLAQSQLSGASSPAIEA